MAVQVDSNVAIASYGADPHRPICIILRNYTELRVYITLYLFYL